MGPQVLTFAQHLRIPPPSVAYVLPMAVYVAVTVFEGMLPRDWYPVAYTLKSAAVTVALIVCAPHWRQEIRLEWRGLVLGLATGFIAFVLWVGLDPITPRIGMLGTRVAFNPFDAIPNPAWRLTFIAIRLYGLAVLVPILEEVFWRSFLLRYFTRDQGWQTVPLGSFSWRALTLATVCFALAHPEWLAAILFALLVSALLRATLNLFSCIVAHAVTNLALGLYVLQTGQWQFW